MAPNFQPWITELTPTVDGKGSCREHASEPRQVDGIFIIGSEFIFSVSTAPGRAA